MSEFERVVEQGRQWGLRVPTREETLRVKAFLLVERRATRDFVDVAALAREMGEAAAITSLGYLNAVYPASGTQTVATRFAETCQAEPLDLAEVPLDSYKGLKPPFTEWRYVAETCRQLGRDVAKLELSNAIPTVLDEGFYLKLP